MNKKLFLGMFAAAGMLLATSCSNDELDMVQSGNEAQVTFNLGTEGGIATRAISDGLSAKKLVCAIYDANETLLDKVVINGEQVDANGQYVNEEAFQGGLTDQVKVTLAKGQEYTMVFWAQNEACEAYTTTDLKAVKVSYKAENGTDNASNNDDTRDAFYAAETFKVEGNKEINVTLKRPFAQVNVGVYKSDWEAAEASGITIKESSVVIKNVADEINLLTGAVKASDAMENGITYALNAIPNDPAILKADANKDGEDEEYQWLSMSYILVNDIDASVDENGLLGTDKALLEGLQFTFKPESGQSITFEEGLAGAPVRRNWRTNILGKILTGDIQFNITIDNEFNEEDYIYPDGSIEQELEFAATFGGEVTLTQDVNLTKTLNVTADMILNLNGKTISGPQEGRDANNNRIHAIVNNANLTINGGKVASIGNNAGSAIYNAADATLTIENVEVLGAPYEKNGSWPSYAINNYGNMTVKSATVKSYHGGIATGGNGVTVIDDATVDVGQGVANGITSWGLYVFEQGQLTVNAGKFENTKTDTNVSGGGYLCTSSTGETIINGGVFDNAVRTGLYVNNGKLTIKGGTFDTDVTSYVAEGYAAVANADGTWTVREGKAVSTVDDLVSALGNPDVKEIFLSSDIELTNGLVFGAATTTYAVRSASSNISGRDVVIDGNGSTITFTAGTNSRLIDVTKETEGMNLTLKNITIENNVSWVQRVINYNTYGTLTLDNVTITHADGCSANYAVNLPGVSNNCTVVINNCNIGATANALNIWGKNVKADVTNSDLYVIDNSAEESYSVIALNNDGAGSSADGTVVNVTGGSLKVTGTHAAQSDAVRNNTETGVVNISTSTEVVGEIEEMVAIVHYEGSTDYYSKATLAGAIQTAKETNAAGIRLIRDVECTEALLIDSNLKIEGNGHTLTTSASRAFRLTTGDIAVEISNLNIVSTAKMVYPNDVRGISLDGNLKNIGLTLNDCTIDFTDETACDWTYGVNISGGSDTYTLNINGGTYEGANVVNIWGSNNIVNIEGATLNSNYKPNEQYSGVCVKLADSEGSGNKVTVKKTTFNATGGNAIAFDDDAVEGANTITQENNTDNTATAKE